jgi:hypothetical protein
VLDGVGIGDADAGFGEADGSAAELDCTHPASAKLAANRSAANATRDPADPPNSGRMSLPRFLAIVRPPRSGRDHTSISEILMGRFLSDLLDVQFGRAEVIRNDS